MKLTMLQCRIVEIVKAWQVINYETLCRHLELFGSYSGAVVGQAIESLILNDRVGYLPGREIDDASIIAVATI